MRYILGPVKIISDILDVPQARLAGAREFTGSNAVLDRLGFDVQEIRDLAHVDQRRLEFPEQPELGFHGETILRALCGLPVKSAIGYLQQNVCVARIARLAPPRQPRADRSDYLTLNA